MNVTLEKITPESDTINTFHFRPEKPLHYTAGQFIELTVPHETPDERGTKHWFTLSSSPTDELLAITTRFSHPSSTFKTALHAIEPGAELHMSDAMGDFVLPKLIQTPLIFVAGGIGVTPFHSMLSWLADTGEVRPIKFLYAVNKEEDIIFQDTFDRAGVHATIVVSEPSDAWGGERGRLNAEMILGLEKPSDDTLIYLSGPEPMVEQLAKDMRSQGVSKHQLVLDMFPNYSISY
jgi:ferredoxin-NADP reductase